MNTQAQQKSIDPAKRWKSARNDLLIILAFTVVNLVLLILENDTYFLFSISVPYYLTAFGMGMDIGIGRGNNFMAVALIVSAIILGVYLLMWLLSKKRPLCLLLAGIAFAVDTIVLIAVAFLLLEEPASSIIDLVFHGYIVFSLISGYFSARKVVAAQEPEVPSASPEF